MFKTKKIVILIFLLVLSVSSIAVNAAAFLQTTWDPVHMFVGQYYNAGTTPPVKWSLRSYYSDYDGTMYGVVNAGERYGAIGIWMSRIQPETYYSFTITVNTNTEGLSSGQILPDGYQYFTLVPDSHFMDLEPGSTSPQEIYTDPVSLIPSDMYKMYYDANSKQLSVVFYVPEDWAQDNLEKLQHVYLLLSIGANLSDVSKTVIVSQTDVLSDGIYTDVLDEIVTKLDEITIAAGGGLTQDDITDAIDKALEQYISEGRGAAADVIQDANQEFSETFQEYNELMSEHNSLIYLFANMSQDAILTIPSIKIPAIGSLVPEMVIYKGDNFNMTQLWDDFIPPAFMFFVRSVTAYFLFMYCYKEIIKIIGNFLNGGEVM